MGDVLLGCLRVLDAYPSQTHWFCPRESAAEAEDYFLDEDVDTTEETEDQTKSRTDKINKYLERRRTFIAAVEIFAYDGQDAVPFQDKLKASLKEQLVGCSICVREYHRMRSAIKHELDSNFPPEQVGAFMDRYDQVNTDRICQGLDSARDDLLEFPPEERRISSLSQPALFALFESMHCVPFIRNETLLAEHFDQPFRLVQTKQKITLPEYTPALTAFLFSQNNDRLQWAIRGWTRIKPDVKDQEFEHAIKEQLHNSMARVQITSLEKDFMPQFWRGVVTILSRLDERIIVHQLRAMDLDLIKLILEHLQVESTCYCDLIQSFTSLLEKAPTAVWDAFSSISAQAVIEQIFNSPNMEKIVLDTTAEDKTRLTQVLAWVPLLIVSTQKGSLPASCKALLHQLLIRLQKDYYPAAARVVCQLLALNVLSDALDNASNRDQSAAVFASIYLADLLILLQPHLGFIMKNLDPSKSNDMTKASLKVVEKALNADISLLAYDLQSLRRKAAARPEAGKASLALWETVTAFHKKSQSIELSSAIIKGSASLVIVEPWSEKKSAEAANEAAAWYQRFQQKHRHVGEVLERISELEGEQLGLFLEDGAEDLLVLLFCSNEDTRQSAAGALKAITLESSRREAIHFMLKTSYAATLNVLSQAFTMISQAQVFWTSTMVLKIGRDVIEALCDTQDGLLRSRNLDDDESAATLAAWETTWVVINSIFNSTEVWSGMGYDKEYMVEFCRDAMDFAGLVFDNYGVFSGVLKAQSADQPDDTDRVLLESTSDASENIVKWLRLRDEYLVREAVKLSSRLMGRLQDSDMILPESALLFVESILKGTIKNNVTSTGKAELRRALNMQIEEVTPKVQAPTKISAKQGSLKDWASSGQPGSQGAASITNHSRESIDLETWKAKMKPKVKTETMEKLRLSGQLPPKVPAKIPAKAPPPSASSTNDFLRKRQEAQEQKRKRDQAAIAAVRKARDGIANAGSGLSGIGVEGKDHVAGKGDNVMVSSDDESDSEDEEASKLDAALFGSSGKSNVRKHANGAIGLKSEVKPTKIRRQLVSSKDRRARLQPNLSPLHREILGWDIFHKGDYPPGSDEWKFKKVLNSFRHLQEYRDIFQPLLTLEAWQGMLRARDEENPKPYGIRISGRSNVDGFVEISTSIGQAELREIQISEGDIILFSKSSKPITDEGAPHCLGRVHSVKRKKNQAEVIYRVMPNVPLSSSLTPNTEVHGAKVQSIIPLEREYGAIAGLEYYDLCELITKGRPSPLLNYTDKQLDPLINTYSVNKAQAKAIRSAMDNDAFTLIQGPPGSGKTKTIVATVGALLTDSLVSSSGTVRITAPGVQSNDGMAKKLLVCAPSNAAVDELVMRFKDGVTTTKGVHKNINVVRLGRSDAVNSAVVDVTLDELVRKKLGVSSTDTSAKDRTQSLMNTHSQVSAALREARSTMDGDGVQGAARSKLQDEIDSLAKRKRELANHIDKAKDEENSAGRDVELRRRRAQQQVIGDSHVICATLSGSGHELFSSLDVDFETVIVDEAAQCVEMSALIPLKYGCIKCILVGDPKQLPPTVFSKAAAGLSYEQSLFVRMQGNHPEAVHLLDTQYRMHPDISAFPSATFYDGRLLDGGDMAGLRKRAWHSSSMLAPYKFFDVQGQHQAAPKGHSLVNHAEIAVALALYDRLTKDYRDYDFANKIGIITPYKSQLRQLKETFSQRYGQSILEAVEFNTTDAFQGRESEIIIFSCVRASPSGGIGFLQDIRRMNVGLTRAKCSLWVLGNSQSLVRGEFWKKLVENAQARDAYISGDLLGQLRKPSSAFPAKNFKPAIPTKSVPRPEVTGDPRKEGKPAQNGAKPLQKTSKQDVLMTEADRRDRSSSITSVTKVKDEVKPERKTSNAANSWTNMYIDSISTGTRIKEEGSRPPSAASSSRMDIDPKSDTDAESKTHVKSEIKARNGLQDEMPSKSRDGTPGSVTASDGNTSDRNTSDRGKSSGGGGGMRLDAPMKPQVVVKRKAASGGIFMPSKRPTKR